MRLNAFARSISNFMAAEKHQESQSCPVRQSAPLYTLFRANMLNFFCCCLGHRAAEGSDSPRSDGNVETLCEANGATDYDLDNPRRVGETPFTPTPKVRSIMDGHTPPSEEYDRMSRGEKDNAVKGWVDHLFAPLVEPVRRIEFETKPKPFNLDYNLVIDASGEILTHLVQPPMARESNLDYSVVVDDSRRII